MVTEKEWNEMLNGMKEYITDIAPSNLTTLSEEEYDFYMSMTAGIMGIIEHMYWDSLQESLENGSMEDE